jgi:predicted house-cleaning NTP pyrophosphatase (Maf/HAM1 superfamily)
MLLALGVPFVVRAAKIDEMPYPREPPESYLSRITRSKLAAVRQLIGWGFGAAILVADTIVIAASGAILGQPFRVVVA